MEIHVRDNKLRKAIQDEARCKRHYGADMARKIMLRLSGASSRRIARRLLAS